MSSSSASSSSAVGHPQDRPPVRPPMSAGIIVKRSLSCGSLSNIPGKVSLLLFFGSSLPFWFGVVFFLLQVPRINEALSSPTATDPETRERCYRLTLETPLIDRSVLGRELDFLWQRYGVEYRVEGVFDHPAEMPLLMDPVVDHRLVRRLPPALSSSPSEETGETRRAPEDFTSLSEFDMSQFGPSAGSVPISTVGSQESSQSVDGRETSSLLERKVSQGAPDNGSVTSSAVTPDTIFECFASAAPPF